jgi:hypothetical protein
MFRITSCQILYGQQFQQVSVHDDLLLRVTSFSAHIVRYFCGTCAISHTLQATYRILTLLCTQRRHFIWLPVFAAVVAVYTSEPVQ